MKFWPCFACALLFIVHPVASQVLIPPQLIGAVATPNDAFDIVLVGHHALVPDYASGLQVIDIADPANPTIAGDYNTPGFAIQAAVDGSLAFVADHTQGGLQVLNVSTPANPTFAGAYVSGDAAVAVAVSGNLAAIGYLEDYLEMVDVGNPQPVSLGTYATPGAPRHIAFGGDRLYVADHSFGLLILDISTPSAPFLVGSYDTGGRPVGLQKTGGIVYLAGGPNGLETLDVLQPTNPSLMGTAAIPGLAVKVVLSGAYAFVAAHVAGGLQVVETSNPYSPSLLGGYVTGNYAHGVAVRGEYAYLVDGIGLKVFRVFDTSLGTSQSLTQRFRLDQNYPNPFHPSSTIRYYVPAGGARVRLTIYDIRGRMIDTLIDGPVGAGEQSASWSATDARGIRLAAGIYLYRLEAPGVTINRKMILLD